MAPEKPQTPPKAMPKSPSKPSRPKSPPTKKVKSEKKASNKANIAPSQQVEARPVAKTVKGSQKTGKVAVKTDVTYSLSAKQAIHPGATPRPKSPKRPASPIKKK